MTKSQNKAVEAQLEQDRREEQAVADVLETVAELGAQSMKALDLPERSQNFRPQVSYCQELFDRIASRARLADMDPAELLHRASDRIAETHRTVDIQIDSIIKLARAA